MRFGTMKKDGSFREEENLTFPIALIDGNIDIYRFRLFNLSGGTIPPK